MTSCSKWRTSQPTKEKSLGYKQQKNMDDEITVYHFNRMHVKNVRFEQKKKSGLFLFFYESYVYFV